MDILRNSQLVIFSPSTIFITFSYKSLVGFLFKLIQSPSRRSGVGFLRLIAVRYISRHRELTKPAVFIRQEAAKQQDKFVRTVAITVLVSARARASFELFNEDFPKPEFVSLSEKPVIVQLEVSTSFKCHVSNLCC